MPNFTPSNPPPPTWQLFCSIKCPQCGQDVHFLPPVWKANERTIYCPNPACPLFNFQYRMRLTSEACEVV